MVLRYYNGKIDERPCIGTRCTSLSCYALMVNADYTIEEVLYDDLDYQNGRVGEPIIDATDEVKNEVRAKACIGKEPMVTPHWFDPFRSCLAGDVVEVVKGRKYPKGTLIEVRETKIYRIPGTYSEWVGYIMGTNGEKVTAHNCMTLIVAPVH